MNKVRRQVYIINDHEIYIRDERVIITLCKLYKRHKTHVFSKKNIANTIAYFKAFDKKRLDFYLLKNNKDGSIFVSLPISENFFFEVLEVIDQENKLIDVIFNVLRENW